MNNNNNNHYNFVTSTDFLLYQLYCYNKIYPLRKLSPCILYSIYASRLVHAVYASNKACTSLLRMI